VRVPACVSLICGLALVLCRSASAQYVVPSPLPNGPLVYRGPNGPVPIPALYEAILRNDRIRVESFLEHGADPNEMCPCGTSPLEAAVAQVKNPEIAELLLSHGANVNGRTPKNTYGTTNDWTPLFYAVHEKRGDLVAVLLKYHAKVDITDIRGASPLYWARERNAPEIVKQLQDAGAADNISASDLKPMTPPEPLTIPAEKVAEVAISHPTPEYPAQARAQRLSGTGVFELQVSLETGEVTSVTVATSTGHSVLDRAATKTLKRWKFRPHTVTRVKLPITFKAPQKRSNQTMQPTDQRPTASLSMTNKLLFQASLALTSGG
jgi:TonB family protein